MEAEDLIKVLNTYIEIKRRDNEIEDKSKLILQRTVTTNNVFKAFKAYEIIVWFYSKGKKQRVITLTFNEKVINDKDDSVLKKINKDLLFNIYNLIETKLFKDIIDGTYDEHSS